MSSRTSSGQESGPAEKTPAKKNAARERGRSGEEAARAYLTGIGYRIVERNYTCAEGEIDLVAWDGAVLCFIEVRLKLSLDRGGPLDTITRPKQRRVIRAALRYLQENGLEETSIRFDAVGVILKGSDHEIEHIPGAFEG